MAVHVYGQTGSLKAIRGAATMHGILIVGRSLELGFSCWSLGSKSFTFPYIMNETGDLVNGCWYAGIRIFVSDMYCSVGYYVLSRGNQTGKVGPSSETTKTGDLSYPPPFPSAQDRWLGRPTGREGSWKWMEMDGWMGPLHEYSEYSEYWRKKSIRICLVILLFVPGFRGFFSDTRVMWNEEMKAGSTSLHDEIVIYLLVQGTSESIPSPQQCYLLSWCELLHKGHGLFGQADYDVGGNLLRLYSKFAEARASRSVLEKKTSDKSEIFFCKLDFIKGTGWNRD